MDYGNHKPVHLKRFTVHPRYRSKGIGKALVDKAKGFVFDELRLPIFFGESNEIGGMSFYGREGALFSTKAIKTYSSRNSPKDNLRFFIEFVTNPKFKTFRYQTGKGIPFVFINDDAIESEYKDKGYMLISEITKQARL
jgi:hypothetical protein